ncbi:AarF/ABC1/UbiB kinase family protein [Longimicrobium sp.]|uniref:ABC1 kinase family protein n=1 Tax=Longimicrobium sp. TaxID=2029185 RepID=UPI002B90BA62|nr:AarF/ABC1/UbiB kinase family protein [Longimicrobium sp.]HSU13012.1 AarF/ABC1/UbiB kinase family protein [Longimicrobium sp.]
MGISLKPEHVKRYRDLAKLMLKYGRSDLVQTAGLEEAVLQEDAASPAGSPNAPQAGELADDLEKLGPTFIKLGQLLSTRPDLLPQPYIDALQRLQDNVEPFPAEEAEAIVSEELGVRVSKAFADFEHEPMAAASLGQVHRAHLRDGRPVAVKVQRPGIRQQIAQDLDALDEIADWMDRHTKTGRQYEFGRTLQEFRKTIIGELDYRREAANLATLGANLAQYERIVVPSPVDDYTTSRVLTMEFVRGKKITALSPLAHLEIDGASLAEELFQAYLKQILIDGFFHADPHPGNVFLTDDGRIALLDLGMVGRISPELQEQLVKLVLAISEGHGPEAAQITIDLGEKKAEFNRAEFVRITADLVNAFQGSTAENVQVGRIMLEVFRAAAENGIRLPVEMAMLGRALLALDQVGRTLDPAFDPNASIRRNVAGLMQQRMLKSLSPQRMFANLLEMNELVQKLPGRLNRFLDSMTDGGTTVQIRVREEVWLMEGMQKIANRLTTGLILAALIVGAAMMMRVQTRFTIWGYPGIAMLFFLGAALIGIWLIISIFRADVHRKTPPKT